MGDFGSVAKVGSSSWLVFEYAAGVHREASRIWQSLLISILRPGSHSAASALLFCFLKKEVQFT